MKCLWCESSKMRTSRLRMDDLLHLLQLQYPVRCRTCGQRDYASIFICWKLPRRQQLFLLGEYAAVAGIHSLSEHREALERQGTPPGHRLL